MDTSDSLFGVLLIDLVAGFAAFFRDGENAQGFERFQGSTRFPMEHLNAKPEIITTIDGGQSYK